MQTDPKAETLVKSETKESKDCCQGGYGYMKRRLGLLSTEADKLKEKGSKPDSKI